MDVCNFVLLNRFCNMVYITLVNMRLSASFHSPCLATLFHHSTTINFSPVQFSFRLCCQATQTRLWKTHVEEHPPTWLQLTAIPTLSKHFWEQERLVNSATFALVNSLILASFSSKDLNSGDHLGWTPAHAAAYHGRTGALKVSLLHEILNQGSTGH